MTYDSRMIEHIIKTEHVAFDSFFVTINQRVFKLATDFGWLVVLGITAL